MLAEPETPAQERNTEKAFFRHPFELSTNLIENDDIRETLMIRHDHIRSLGVDVFEPVHTDFPIRIQTDHGTRPPITLPVQDLPLRIKRKGEDKKDKHDQIKKREQEHARDPEKQ